MQVDKNMCLFLCFSSSGRTQKQVLDYVKEGGHKKVQFER